MSTNLDYHKLTAEERLALIGDIWDSLDPEDLRLSDAQREELDRRLDDSEKAANAGMPWEQVRKQIESRKK